MERTGDSTFFKPQCSTGETCWEVDFSWSGGKKLVVSNHSEWNRGKSSRKNWKNWFSFGFISGSSSGSGEVGLRQICGCAKLFWQSEADKRLSGNEGFVFLHLMHSLVSHRWCVLREYFRGAFTGSGIEMVKLLDEFGGFQLTIFECCVIRVIWDWSVLLRLAAGNAPVAVQTVTKSKLLLARDAISPEKPGWSCQ